MGTRAFAEQLYEFLKENEPDERYAEAPPEVCIAELENHLSDVHYVKETLKDIEEVADEIDDDEFYREVLEPLVIGLSEIRDELEAAPVKRMVSDTGYEVKLATRLGDKEILVAEDTDAADGNYYFIADYRVYGIIAEYSHCQVSGDYLEIMGEYAARVSRQVDALNTEISAADYQTELITPEQCHPLRQNESLVGEVVAIKAEVLRAEYRRGDVQLVYVTHGKGAEPYAQGADVHCFHLSDGKHSLFYHRDIQGKVKELPDWAKERLGVLLAEREAKNPVEPEKVGGYTITQSIEVGAKQFALGENPDAQSPYATWQRKEGREGYDIGHYFIDRDAAIKDLHERADIEREDIADGKGRKPKSRDAR